MRRILASFGIQRERLPEDVVDHSSRLHARFIDDIYSVPCNRCSNAVESKGSGLFDHKRRLAPLPFESPDTIQTRVGLQHDAVGVWRRRWRDNWQRLIDIECAEKLHVLEQEIQKLLSDLQRAGRKPRISSEQQAAIFKKHATTQRAAIDQLPRGPIENCLCN